MYNKSTINSIFSVIVFLLSSMTTTITNKYITSVLNFHLHYLLIVITSFVICIIIILYDIFYKKRIQLKSGCKWILPSIFLTIMIVSNTKALFYLDVTLFTLYKNCSILIVAIAENILFKRKISLLGIFSLFLIILSSYFAKVSTEQQTIGLVWMFVNVLSSSIYPLYLKKMIDNDGSRMEITFFTNLFSIPFILLFSLIFDDYEKKLETSEICVIWIFITSVSTFYTAFSSAWVLRNLSSTALCMFGAIGKLLLSIIGIILFKEKITPVKVMIISIGMLGGLLYSIDIMMKQEE